MMRILLIMLFAALIYSCKQEEKKPADILPPDKMELVLWDYLRADTYTSEFLKKDSTADDTLLNMKMQEVIFKHHGISKEKFYKSYQYYIQQPGVMVNMIDSMVARQQRKSTGKGIKEFVN